MVSKAQQIRHLSNVHAKCMYIKPEPDTNERTVLALDEILLLDGISSRVTIYIHYTANGGQFSTYIMYKKIELDGRVTFCQCYMAPKNMRRSIAEPVRPAQARHSIHKYMQTYAIQVNVLETESVVSCSIVMTQIL